MEKSKQKVLQVRISPEVIGRVEISAKKNRRTKSAQVEQLLVNALKEEDIDAYTEENFLGGTNNNSRA